LQYPSGKPLIGATESSTMIQEPRLCQICGSAVFVVELWEDAAEVKLCASCRAAYQEWRLDPQTGAQPPRIRARPDVVTFLKERNAWLVEKQKQKQSKSGPEQPARPARGAWADNAAPEPPRMV
jgi:hypothetical protein